MRKVIYAMSVSLDGFIEAADGDIGWSVPDAELHQHFNDQERTLDALLYGRRLYETMNAFWPTADQDPQAPPVVIEYARIWREKKKIVFSRSLRRVEGNAELAGDDLISTVRALKALPGTAMSVGGAGLAASFMQLGLIDEYRLYIHPVLLGSGKPMLAHLKHRLDLELVDTHTFASGVALLAYRPASRPDLPDI